ncbi:MAG: DUF5018 domain-containing protein, partial [Muribaculaceae bacterium]
MKKNILLLLAVVLLAMTSCEDPQYVAPTANRQGLTSLTAIFTSGPFVDQTMAKLDITDPIPDRLVIPVPYYYPISSDDETAQYMTNVRVQAALAANCFISPALTVLDLTKENEFTFTDAQGVSKKIIITGERVKSNACELLTFTVTSHEIAGIVDKATKSVALATTEDLSDVTVECEVSPHATISPDPASVHNLNDPVKFTVTAHDGTTAEYTVAKVVYEKIEQGFNKESVELLFNFDPVASLGMPAFDVEVGPTIAALHGKVVLCAGDGSTPIYINAMTGAKQGEIALGSAVPGAVTNDEGEHLLICNHAGSSETMNIYWTSSVKDTPKLLTSFTNTCDLALGSKIKCIGIYSKYLNVTAAEYGEVMQAALKDRDFSVGRLIDYRVGIDPDGVATWVESHDNFANDEMDSVWMTDEDIKLGWAAITAREKTTTVFYDRPLGAGGTTYDSRFPGLTQIGDAGSELYKDDEIVAVNIFRNTMEHEDEYMRNIYNGKILMIERGTKGAVIINLNDNDVYIESDTRLDSKVYENHTDDG